MLCFLKPPPEPVRRFLDLPNVAIEIVEDSWQLSAKATARLQAASTSGRPVLLRLDEQAGHGVGSTAQQSFSKLADVYSFLLWQFGKLNATP